MLLGTSELGGGVPSGAVEQQDGVGCRQNNRSVDLRLRVRCVRTTSGGRSERQNDGHNSQASPRATHRSLHRLRGMKTCPRRKPLDAGMIGRQGVFQIRDGPKRTALENLNAAGAQQAHN